MYYIMSYNVLRGIVGGTFAEPDHLFYRGPQKDGTVQWVPLLSVAKEFPTEAQARGEIHRVFGDTGLSLGVLFYDERHDANCIHEQEAHNAYKTRKEMARTLCTGRATAVDLKFLAKGIPQETGLTWRERWIIDIMTKGEANGS